MVSDVNLHPYNKEGDKEVDEEADAKDKATDDMAKEIAAADAEGGKGAAEGADVSDLAAFDNYFDDADPAEGATAQSGKMEPADDDGLPLDKDDFDAEYAKKKAARVEVGLVQA